MKFLILFLISLNAFGQSSNPNDTLKIGKSSSSADKGLIFDTNDGVLNKTLKVNPVSKGLNWSGNLIQMGDGASVNDKELIIDPASSTSLKWNGSDNYVELRSSNIRLGKGASEDITQELDVGLGASNPKIKWDNTKGKLVFSNDGVKENAFGTGGGAGGGENFNNAFGADDNAGGEDGTTGWTASAGTLATVANAANDPLGELSLTWIPAAQNDTVDSNVFSFNRDIFKGKSCEARIEYIGGDENLSLEVINGNDVVIASEVLKAHSIWGSESVFLLCPSDADIVGDAELGNLRYRIKNTGASASPLIKWDTSYIGTLRGLTETTLPDVMSAFIDSNGNVFNESVDWIDGNCSEAGNFQISCNLKSGIVSLPMNCSLTFQDITSIGAQQTVKMWANTNTGFSYFRNDADASAASSGNVNVICHKQGADAKQSVQVYKSIPKVSENVNRFSFYVGGAGSLESEDVNHISGCVRNSIGDYTCTFNVGALSARPSCTVSASGNNPNISTDIALLDNAAIRYKIKDVVGAALVDRRAFVNCGKQEADFKMPTVQPVIVGQVTNSYAESASKNVRVESCRVANAGTPTFGSELCGTWIGSLTDSGVGRIDLNLIAGVFSGSPSCTISTYGANYQAQFTGTINNSLIQTELVTTDGLTDSDRPFWITCVGAK